MLETIPWQVLLCNCLFSDDRTIPFPDAPDFREINCTCRYEVGLLRIAYLYLTAGSLQAPNGCKVKAFRIRNVTAPASTVAMNIPNDAPNASPYSA